MHVFNFRLPARKIRLPTGIIISRENNSAKYLLKSTLPRLPNDVVQEYIGVIIRE